MPFKSVGMGPGSISRPKADLQIFLPFAARHRLAKRICEASYIFKFEPCGLNSTCDPSKRAFVLPLFPWWFSLFPFTTKDHEVTRSLC
jgi:hypothetical protein